MPKERTGIGSAAKLPAARRTSGAGRRRVLVTSTLKRRIWTDLVKTGRLIMPKLLLGFRKRSGTWVWRARFRTAQAIRTGTIFQPFRGGALTILFKKVPRKSAYRTCRTVAHS